MKSYLSLLSILILINSSLLCQKVALTRDLNFGDNGSLSIPAKTNNSLESKLFACNINKLYVVLNYNNDSTDLLRYNSEGSIDIEFSFQINGSLNLKTLCEISDDDSVVYLLGICKTEYFYPIIFKLKNSGEVDTTFNKSGFLSFPQDTLISDFEEIRIAKDDSAKIYFTYRTKIINSKKLTLRVINKDGTEDSSYKTYLFEETDSINSKPFFLFSATITPDDKILVAGQHDPEWYFGLNDSYPIKGNGLIIKLNKDGSTCNTFGNNGILLVDTEEIQLLRSLSLLQNMSFLLEGQVGDFSKFGHFTQENPSNNSLAEWLDTDIFQPQSLYDGYKYLNFPNGNISLCSNGSFLDINWEQNSVDTLFSISGFHDFSINLKEELFIARYDSPDLFIDKYTLDTIIRPNTQLSGISTYWETDNSANIKWTKGDGKRSVLFLSKTDSIFPNINDRKTYYPSKDWESKLSKIVESGWYCVYNDTGDSVIIKSLEREKKYWITGIESNGASGWERYNHNISEGNTFILTDQNSSNLFSSTKPSHFNVFPNPAKDKIIIEFKSNSPKQVKLIDLNGKEVLSETSINSDLLLINTMNYSRGIYFIQAIFDNKIEIKQIILK